MAESSFWGGVAVITGGTKGIGLATAERVAALVDEVILVYRSDEEAAASAATQVALAGGRPTLLQGDVGDEATFEELGELLAQRRLPVSLLAHSAVDTTAVDLLRSDTATIRRAVDVNGMSMMLAARTVDPYVADGSLAVFLSSRGAVSTLPNYAGIGVPKAMAESAVRYIAVAWAERGARALTLAPGAVDTPSLRGAAPDPEAYLAAALARTPLGRLTTPEDVADTIVALRSTGMSTITGGRIPMDGGTSLL